MRAHDIVLGGFYAVSYDLGRIPREVRRVRVVEKGLVRHTMKGIRKDGIRVEPDGGVLKPAEILRPWGEHATGAPPALTHYGVIVFSGDPMGEHPDPELRGHAPSMELIAHGTDAAFCWKALEDWTAKNPLRMWETAEVLEKESEG